MIKGHLYPDMSQINDDTLCCRLKVYLSTVALISSLYSTTSQVLYHFFRIIYYNRPFFHVNIYFYIFILLIQRILWLIIFILVFGMPACSTTIIFYLFGYIGWWANHLTWSTFILSFIGDQIELIRQQQ
ncbi:unnamed protein product [Rotaria sp. Silwood1]|nr:unnamed protein product [Rotaria sp. Silwood1]CAF5090566.1 unnamed protein product [Rotaria sp. Silwood1]